MNWKHPIIKAISVVLGTVLLAPLAILWAFILVAAAYNDAEATYVLLVFLAALFGCGLIGYGVEK